jgi:hypothetical protein
MPAQVFLKQLLGKARKFDVLVILVTDHVILRETLLLRIVAHSVQ